MNEDDDFFLKQMRGVNPIKKKNRIKKETQKPSQKIKTTNKKSKTTQTQNKQNNNETIIKKSKFVLEKANIKKTIKKGLIKIDKKIDFHGKTLLESEELFSSTVLSCHQKGMRCLLFVTGKGLFKKKGLGEHTSPKLYYGVIRSAFTSWVNSKKFSKYILSYEKASTHHGGEGAFYVYLRKYRN